jgi:hypothetical protein
MSDFADNYLAHHPNPLGIPQLSIDPSLAPPAGSPALLPTQLGGGGGSLDSMFNLYSHYTDAPAGPDVTLGYGARVGDPSSATYNLGRGPVVPQLSVDQTGAVTGGVALPSGTSAGVQVNTQGVAQGQVGQSVGVGGGQLNIQGNAATDGTVGGQVAYQRGDMRFGVNGGVNPTNGQGNVGAGFSVRF